MSYEINVGITKLNRFNQNSCRICKKVFCCEVCRTKHEKNLHNLTQNCDICIYGRISSFSISSNLIDHLKSDHWPLHCVICQRLFGSVEEIFNHKKCPIRHSSPLTNNSNSNSPSIFYIGSRSKEYYLSPFSPVEAMQQFGLQNNVSNRATSTPMQKNENMVLNNIAKIISTPAEDSGNSKKSRLLPSHSNSLKRVTFSTPLTKEENDIDESTDFNSLLYYSAVDEEIVDELDKDNNITPPTSSNTESNKVHSPLLTSEEPAENEETNPVLFKEKSEALFVSAIDSFSKDKIMKTLNVPPEPESPPKANIQVTEVLNQSEIVAVLSANITQKVYIRHSNHWKVNSSLQYSKNKRLSLNQEPSTSSATNDSYFNSNRTDNQNIAETPVIKNPKSTDFTTRQITKPALLLHVNNSEISPDRLLNCDKAHTSNLLVYNETSRSNYKVYVNDESKQSSMVWLNKIWESFNSLLRTRQKPFHDNDITPQISQHFTQSVKRYSTDMDLTNEHSPKRFKSTDIRGRPPIRPSVGSIEFFRTGFSDVKRFADKATQTYEADFLLVDSID